MKFKQLILSLSLILLSISTSYSNENCPDCETTSMTPITYSVDYFDCGVCVYTVHYSKCINSNTFIIDSIRADNSNPTCCQGTAANDPIVSGFILQEAADLIGSAYTPSRCWKWVGTLGPYGIHDAVFVPCDYDVSCCYFHDGTWTHYGPETCDLEQACMQICD